jgi:hypothetical protein
MIVSEKMPVDTCSRGATTSENSPKLTRRSRPAQAGTL